MKELRFYENFYFVTYRYGTSAHYDRSMGAPWHYFNYIVRGSARLVTDKEVLELKAGDFYYMPKGLRYQVYWQSEDTVTLPSLGTAILPDAAVIPYKLQKLPLEFVEEFLRIPRNAPLTVSTLAKFYTFLEHILPHMEQDLQDPAALLLQRFRSFVEKNPRARIPEIARHCGVGDSTLYATVQKATGKTPNALRQEILVDKAVHMLSTTDKSITLISDLLGFGSATYFRQIVKKHTGFSPRQIRSSSDRT